MAKENSKIIKEAYGEYEVLTGDAEVKRLEEVRLMSRLEEEAALASARQRGTEEGLKQGKEEGLKQGKGEGLKQGKEEGLKQGEKEEKIRTTKKLIEKNMPIEQIEEITGLTKEEILKIKDNNL